jgi:hypothetical protein
MLLQTPTMHCSKLQVATGSAVICSIYISAVLVRISPSTSALIGDPLLLLLLLLLLLPVLLLVLLLRLPGQHC